MKRATYWQHETPLACPLNHLMIWLGFAFWICGECKTIYVQQAPQTTAAIPGMNAGGEK